MPFNGVVYSQKELIKLLDISKQAVSNLAYRQGWDGPGRGLYWAMYVEPELEDRGIDPLSLPIVDIDYPQGATLTEREKEYQEFMEE